MATIRERQSANGDKSYQVIVRLKGYPAQTATFSRKTDAKRWATQTEAAIREGRHFKTTEAKKHTMGELIDRYIERVLPTKPKSYVTQKGQLNWWRDEIGEYVLSDVTSSMLSDTRDKLLASGRSQATTVRYMSVLSHAFNIAINEWEWLESSPMQKVSKPKEPRGRVRFLSDDERSKLLAECSASDERALYPIVLLAISTGMRQGEIVNLVWSDIDFQRNQITLHQTKNDERRAVPMVGLAREKMYEFAKVRELGVDLVFPGRKKDKPIIFRKQWLKALERAEISDFKFHDLRHTAASYLAMNGATLAEIAEILGHKTLAMVKRYAHLSEAHTASVVEKMNSKIFGV